MLTLVKFPTQLFYTAQFHDPISRNLPKFQLAFSTDLNFRVFRSKSQNGLCVKAAKNGEFALSESDDFDVDDDYDDDDVFIPLDNMKKWLENKPRGFGEGKVYDTSIEDTLMEEIEQSRRAQIANVNKLKNGYVKQSVNKDTSKERNESEDIKDVFRVRLTNLPKKKNIHKDLRLAFEGVPGILNIIPTVSGNEKTRDPVCKGLAFVDFKSQDDAHRFVQKFSATYISFGKVQKQIKCEMVNPKALDQLGPEINSTLEQQDLDISEDMDHIFELEVSLSDSIREDSFSSELDDDDDGEERDISTLYDDDGEIHNASADGEESDTKSSKKVTKTRGNKKKASPSKQNKDKIPKLNIPGSAKRLKIREKAMLANVFSKYRADSDLKVAETK